MRTLIASRSGYEPQIDLGRPSRWILLARAVEFCVFDHAGVEDFEGDGVGLYISVGCAGCVGCDLLGRIRFEIDGIVGIGKSLGVCDFVFLFDTWKYRVGGH